MVPGWEGTEEVVTLNVLAVPFPHEFEGITWMVPETDPTVAVIAFVVLPAVKVHPAGSVHVYVTPLTFVTLYACREP
jgi:hypothetical protein